MLDFYKNEIQKVPLSNGEAIPATCRVFRENGKVTGFRVMLETLNANINIEKTQQAFSQEWQPASVDINHHGHYRNRLTEVETLGLALLQAVKIAEALNTEAGE